MSSRAKWDIEYIDPITEAIVAYDAEMEQISQDLDGDAVASFWLINKADNRALIQQDLVTNIYFDNKLQFSGILSGGEIGSKKIKATCYEAMPLILDQAEPFTGVYDAVSAKTIVEAVLAGTTLTTDAT